MEVFLTASPISVENGSRFRYETDIAVAERGTRFEVDLTDSQPLSYSYSYSYY